MAGIDMGSLFDTQITFNPDTILPDESTVQFEFQAKKVHKIAVFKMNGELRSNDGFSDDEILSWKAYVTQHRAQFNKIIRESK